MANVRQELALAARRVRLVVESLPEHLRPDVASAWDELLERVEDATTTAAKLEAIAEWRERVEGRLTALLANAPLDHNGGDQR